MLLRRLSLSIRRPPSADALHWDRYYQSVNNTIQSWFQPTLMAALGAPLGDYGCIERGDVSFR